MAGPPKEKRMAQILVRNLDPRAVRRLKRQARVNGRSLQAEAKTIIENAAKLDMASARRLAGRIRAKFQGRKMADSTVLIREDRER
jgi:plasmid stability protein